MSEPLAAARPDFFGKDNFCPFIGQVEDVNDPNKSGRVKVRCIGWHHYNRGETGAGGSGKDALPTADLPWARVGMPTTHAQQSRIGGKHGLQVGSWVMGFFVDGEEAQDPFVLCTFNHTARTSEVNNRKDVGGTTGTKPDNERAFIKTAVSEQTISTSTTTTKEPGGNGGDPADPAKDTVCIDSIDEFGDSLISAAVAERIKTKYSADNPSAENVGVTSGDGRCGRVQHSKTDTQKIIQENFPSATDRFTYGDKVWELTTGNSINLNGTLLQMAQQISGFMKQPVNAKKGRQEDEVNRPAHSAAVHDQPDRDGLLRVAIDIEKAFEIDELSAIFHESSINGLSSIILSLLQLMDNNGVETEGENLTGIIGAGATTAISNTSAACLAAGLLEAIDAITDVALEDAIIAVAAIIEALNAGDGIVSFLNGVTRVAKLASSLKTGNPIDDFNTVEKFSENQNIFHGAGDRTKDLRQLACQVERIYQTAEGYLSKIPSIGAGAGGFGGVPGLAGAGGGAGRGFGGIDTLINPIVNVIPCEDALTQFFPDDYDDPRFPDPNDDGGYGDDLINGGNDPNRPSSITDIDITGPRVVQVGKRAKYVADVSMDDDSYSVYNKYYWSVSPEEPLITNASREEMSSDIIAKFSNTGRYTLKVRVENDRAKNSPVTKTFKVQVRTKSRMSDDDIIPGVNTFPAGKFAIIKAISEPSSDPDAANNFIRGLPNQAVVINPGKQYYFRNQVNPKNVFPTTFIRGYAGTPIPVIDKNTGEYVALLTSPISWSTEHPKVPITVIPDNNDVGILSQDPNFDIELGGFYIQNTGRGYKVPTINIIDKDTGLKNGEVEAVVVDGRIVDLKIKNSGTNFKRIPRIEIIDNGKSKLLTELESELRRRGLSSNIRQKGDKPK